MAPCLKSRTLLPLPPTNYPLLKKEEDSFNLDSFWEFDFCENYVQLGSSILRLRGLKIEN